jgi:serine/threonine-protein kinase
VIDLTGKTLASRYDLLALIGTGGMGAVYRARDRELDELVALKVIRADLAVLPAMAERFRHEVKLARRVTHHNVARTFELGSSDGVLFCTMELIDGESLTTRLVQKRRLPVAEAVAIASAMCDALEAAHAAGVIHRDIKPDNVLIADDGRVVLADFGVAAVAAAEGELSGTPAYMAPEQGRGETPTPVADVYAVGVVLFEMLAGRRAFAGEPMTILDAKQSLEHVTLGASDAPPELAEVVSRATNRDPAARYASAAALGRALAPWARPGRAPTQPHRPAELTGVHTVYVVGTRGDARPGLYLANAVHEQLLARLRRIPRVRVLARYGELEDVLDEGAILISVDAHETLSIALGGTRIEVPLHIDQIGPAVELAVRAFEAEIHRSAPIDPRTSEIEDMLLRARHVLLDNVRNTKAAMEMLERAHAMSPDEPRITANLAISHVRMAFFIGDSPLTSLARAVELSERAVRDAPHLADSHIAAAHVALNTGNRSPQRSTFAPRSRVRRTSPRHTSSSAACCSRPASSTPRWRGSKRRCGSRPGRGWSAGTSAAPGCSRAATSSTASSRPSSSPRAAIVRCRGCATCGGARTSRSCASSGRGSRTSSPARSRRRRSS